MKLSIPKKDLLRALERTHSVADRKSSMPILSNVLLAADGPKTVRLAATDLYLGVTTNVAATIESGGMVAVSARTLFEIVRSLPEGEVSLELDDNHALHLRVGKVHFRVPGAPGSDFPTLPSPGDAKFADLAAEPLGRLIAMTHYSMSNDETRPHLAGALLEGEGKVVRMVTTDGHRLSKAEFKRSGSSLFNFSMLVPAKGIGELRRLVESRGEGSKDEAIGIATAGGNAFFRRDDVLLSVKLADEQFPPYAKVIPQRTERRVVVNRALLIDAVKRISLMASDRSGALRFAVEPGVLRITSESPEVGEGSEELDVDFAGEGVQAGFNARYLLDVLGALTDDEVAFELGGALDPGVVKPVGKTEFIGVIMPMRI